MTPTAAGDIASFDDGAEDIPVKSLVVDIEPAQDLNGYDAPWPPGGGKNLLDPLYRTQTATNVYYYKDTGFDLRGGVTYTLSSSQTALGLYIHRLSPAPVAALAVSYNSNFLTYTPDADVTVYFDFYATSYDPSTVALQLELGSATTYEPYSNICPISGWTGAKVQRTGKNLLDLNRSAGIPTPAEFDESASPRIMDTAHYYVGLTPNNFYDAGRVLNLNVSSGTVSFRCKYAFYGLAFPVSVVGGSQYIASGELENCNFVFGFYDKNWNYLSYSTNNPVMTPAECSYMTVCIALNEGVPDELTCTCTNIQLELGSTATDYEPYQGDTYDISFPDEAGTVYGGTLDVANGVLTVDRAMWDLGELSWNADATRPGVYYTGSLMNRLKNYGNVLCSQYAFWASAVTLDVDYYISLAPSYNSSSPYLRDTRFAGYTGVEVKQALSGVQAVFELATPITYQLTPTEVTTLLGVNNVYADTGDSTVTYRADPTKIYEKLMNAMLAMTGGN